jgi:FKBP-type peptidyl-prolyl cis-trans isomerase 2
MKSKIALVMGILFLLVFFTACSNDEPITIVENETQVVEQKPITGIQEGDLVEMNFVLYGADGRVIDTNDKEKAQEAELKTYSSGTYRFIVGQSSKVKGFDNAVIGLEKGDEITRNILPSTNKIELEFDIETTEPRAKTIQRKQRFSLDSFEQVFGKPPIIGDVVANPDKFPWPYKILAIHNKTALGEIVIKEGDDITLPGTQWKSKALQVSDLAIQFFQNPKQGQIIETEFGTAIMETARSQMKKTHNPILGKEFFYTVPSGQLISPRYEFRVTDIGDEKFTISRINWPEQENLKLEVEIVDVLSNTEITKMNLVS